MKIGTLIAVTAFTSLIASQAMAVQLGYLNGGAEDYTGISTIGVDVSHVGWAPSAARAFVADLDSQRGAAVERACDYALDHQADYHPEVLMFCRNLAGG